MRKFEAMKFICCLKQYLVHIGYKIRRVHIKRNHRNHYGRDTVYDEFIPEVNVNQLLSQSSIESCSPAQDDSA